MRKEGLFIFKVSQSLSIFFGLRVAQGHKKGTLDKSLAYLPQPPIYFVYMELFTCHTQSIVDENMGKKTTLQSQKRFLNCALF